MGPERARTPQLFGEVDFNKWTIEGMPQLGGSGYFYEGESDWSGVWFASPQRARAISTHKDALPPMRLAQNRADLLTAPPSGADDVQTASGHSVCMTTYAS